MAWSDIGKSGYYSHTQISMYRRCPKQYEFRYVKGLKQPPTGPLVLGSSVHAGIELNYINKFKKKVAAKLKDTCDAMSKYFDSNKSGVDFKGEKSGVVKDRGYRMLEVHHRELAPSIQPIALPEKEFLVKVQGVDKPIKGYIDVVAVTKAGKTIVDNKTAGRKKDVFDVHVDDQLTMYGMAEKMTTGVAPKALGFDVLVGNKSGVESQRIVTYRDEERYKELQDTIRMVDRGIKTGVFPPTSNAQVCSWCGFADKCPQAKRALADRVKRKS